MNRQTRKKQRDQKREAIGILLMAFALLIFLGLVSYHQTDYPNSGSPDAVRNWLGLAGSWISYYLYVYTIGYACLIFPLLLFMLGWTIFLRRDFRNLFRMSLYILALGVFLSTTLGMPEAVSEEGSKYGFRLSGLLGGFIAEQLARYLGTAGSIVVLLTFLLIFFVSATSWSMRDALLEFRQSLQSLTGGFMKRLRKPRLIPREKKRRRERDKRREAGKEPDIPDRPVPRSVQDVPKQRTPTAGTEKRVEPEEKRAPAVKPETVTHTGGTFQFPPLDLMGPSSPIDQSVDTRMLERKARFLEEKLREFDIRGDVMGFQPGPVITRFEIKPAPGVKISRFVSCQDDLALVMQASRVRVVAPIPGKAAVGIEVPNEEPALVDLRGILEANAFRKSHSKLTLALGLTIDGRPYATDLAQMPHLLVAGATGSGKSVCLNTIIMSILYRADPSDVKLVLIDPKKLELTLYRKLRNHHLTTREDLDEEVITTVNNAVSVLRSLEVEMENRYRILAAAGVRNIADYNRAVKAGKLTVKDGEAPRTFPYVVLIVDELADLMVTGAREVEEPIARLAQMSRAVGIHLILATQRPSVDVITGIIKANFPSRIAFQVAAKTDSRTILDRNGAEKLLGRGDMLFLHPREPEPLRIHGAFVSTEQVQRVVDFVSRQPRVAEWRLPSFGSREKTESGGRQAERDALFEEAARLVIRHQQGSASLLQRRLRIGYARAGRLVDELEEAGILGPFDGSKAREVLVDESALARLSEMGPLGDNEEEEM